jgi:thymidylate synthase ThyX
MQDYTTAHGYEMPEEIEAAGLSGRYADTMRRSRDAATQLGTPQADEAAEQSQYVIPLAFRKRTLFKMDLAEAIYISELRTGVAGHFSYRNVAFAMYEAVARRYPALAKYFRVTDVRDPVDLLKR